MTNKNRLTAFLASGVVATALMGAAGAASALTITDQVPGTTGLQFNYELNGGAFVTDNAAVPSTFSNEFLSVFTNDSTLEDATAYLSLYEIPYYSFGGANYFQFVYDAQEAGNDFPIRIDQIVLSVDGTAVWSLAESILLNSAAPYSPTPRNDGGDLALYVPLSVLDGLALTATSQLKFQTVQSRDDNGPDEWVLVGGGSYLLPPDATVVPEPSSVLLLSLGLAGLAGARRKLRG